MGALPAQAQDYILAGGKGSEESVMHASVSKEGVADLQSTTAIHKTNIHFRSKISPEKRDKQLDLCGKCFVYKYKCSCSKLCNSCNQTKNHDELCQCDSEFISVLRTQINKNFTSEDNLDIDQDNIIRHHDDFISDDEQLAVSSLIDEKLDLMDMSPPDPGQNVDLSHCTSEMKNIIGDLMKKYENSFSRHKYDTGTFRGFMAKLDVDPEASHIEKERPMQPDAKKCLQPIVDELVKHGILKLADKQGNFVSNCHAVAKPLKGVRIMGKVDKFLAQKSGQVGDFSRITLDLRGLNRHCPSRPKINLPSYVDLVRKFKKKHVTRFDITSMYWSMQTMYDSHNLTNSFFGNHVYSFCVLPMGFVNSSYVSQTATELCYSQKSMLKFIESKSWSLGSEHWPFFHICELAIVYVDDVCVVSPNDIPNSLEIHKNVVEFVLWATSQYGFKIGPAKFNPFVTRFKFLGHFFDVERSCTMIPPT